MYQPITYDLLKSKGTCVEQLKLFRKHFGVKKSVPLTKAVARKFASVFDIIWAALNLLTCEDLTEYKKVCDQAYAEYEKVSAQAWDKFGKVSDQAYAEYKKVRDQAWDKFGKVCAVEFVRIYKRGLTSK